MRMVALYGLQTCMSLYMLVCSSFELAVVVWNNDINVYMCQSTSYAVRDRGPQPDKGSNILYACARVAARTRSRYRRWKLLGAAELILYSSQDSGASSLAGISGFVCIFKPLEKLGRVAAGHTPIFRPPRFERTLTKHMLTNRAASDGPGMPVNASS